MFFISFLKAINSVSPNTGSTVGGTILTINGSYLYSDDKVPAKITIGSMIYCIFYGLGENEWKLRNQIIKLKVQTVKYWVILN